jgi:hypothetical protein
MAATSVSHASSNVLFNADIDSPIMIANVFCVKVLVCFERMGEMGESLDLFNGLHLISSAKRGKSSHFFFFSSYFYNFA